MKANAKMITTTRIRKIITHFIDNCECEEIKRFGFDESFWETTYECEEEWVDDDSDEMKYSLIDNYLYQFGYHTLEEEDAIAKEELIINYLK